MFANKWLVRSLVLLGILALSVWAYRDLDYRQTFGRVTTVSLSNWDQEVVATKEQIPVLIYFRNDSESDQQRMEVESFAWRNAGQVKVVKLDCEPKKHPANLVFMVRFAVVRCPAFVVMYKDKEIHGADGTDADGHELNRLVRQATGP